MSMRPKPHRYDWPESAGDYNTRRGADWDSTIDRWIDRALARDDVRLGRALRAQREWEACPVQPGRRQLAPLRYDYSDASLADAWTMQVCAPLRREWRQLPERVGQEERARAEWLSNPVRPGDPAPEAWYR